MITTEAVATLMQAVAAESGVAGTRLIAGRAAVWHRRARRRDVYDNFESAVLLARVRVELVASVHSARLNPLAVVAVFGGWPSQVESIDRVMVSLAAVAAEHRKVSALGILRSTGCVDEVVSALAHLLSQVDPGPLSPWKRPRFRQDRQAAALRYDEALAAFGRAVRADAGRTRRERRSA